MLLEFAQLLGIDVQYMTKTKRLPFPPKTLSLPPSPPSILYPACPSAAIVKLS